jgi:intracellular multiplication protein IcmD
LEYLVRNFGVLIFLLAEGIMNMKAIFGTTPSKKILSNILLLCGILSLFLLIPSAYAGTTGGGGSDVGLAGVAKNILAGLKDIGAAIFAAAYVAGAGFALGAMMKFKQHKDNPTQIPIGTPLALLFIAVALLFLPSLLKVSSESLFGSNPTAACPQGFTVSATGGSCDKSQ